jgi:hypothetical protein
MPAKKATSIDAERAKRMRALPREVGTDNDPASFDRAFDKVVRPRRSFRQDSLFQEIGCEEVGRWQSSPRRRTPPPPKADGGPPRANRGQPRETLDLVLLCHKLLR